MKITILVRKSKWETWMNASWKVESIIVETKLNAVDMIEKDHGTCKRWCVRVTKQDCLQKFKDDKFFDLWACAGQCFYSLTKSQLGVSNWQMKISQWECSITKFVQRILIVHDMQHWCGSTCDDHKTMQLKTTTLQSFWSCWHFWSLRNLTLCVTEMCQSPKSDWRWNHWEE